jgi:hypothetical protein
MAVRTGRLAVLARAAAMSSSTPCLRQRVSWASTVPFVDSPSSLPPQKTIARLPPDGIVMAVVQ